LRRAKKQARNKPEIVVTNGWNAYDKGVNGLVTCFFFLPAHFKGKNNRPQQEVVDPF